MQISQKLAADRVTVAGATLRLDHLCSGTLVTGMTGTGKTLSLVNPMAAEILKLRSGHAAKKAACVYLNAKGQGYRDFIRRLPPSRRRDVVRVSPDRPHRLCLFARRHWPDQESLASAAQDFLLEAARHASGNDDRHGNHKLYWDGQRDRLLRAAGSLHLVAETVAPEARRLYFPDSALSGVVARTQLLIDYVNATRDIPASPQLSSLEMVEKFFDLPADQLRRTLGEARSALEERTSDSIDDELSAEAIARMIAALDPPAKGQLKTRPERELQAIYAKCPMRMRHSLMADTHYWQALSQETWRSVEGDVQPTMRAFRSSLAEKFLTSHLDSTAVCLEQVIHEGKILIVDCPVTDSANASRNLLILIQLAFMRTMLARYSLVCPDGSAFNQTRPVVFVADEFHSILSSGRNDGLEVFLSQAREFGCISILATQNLQLVLSAMGSFSKFAALVALFGTRFFGKNLDSFTNEFASAACGPSLKVHERRVGMVFGGCDPAIKDLLTVPSVAARIAIDANRFCSLAPGQFVCVDQEGKASFLDARTHLPAPVATSL